MLLTEGEKEGAAADQHGFACVALSGVWAWQVKRAKNERGRGAGPRQLIPDLTALAWKGRRVVIAFDSDVQEKPEVRWAEWYLTEVLREAGADVRVIRLPGGSSGEKIGLDDYLLAHGAEALRELVGNASAPTKPVENDNCPEIVVDTDEWRVNGKAVLALATEPDLYQRGGMLVHVVSTESAPEPNGAVRRPPGSLVVREIPPPLLRARLTRCARWVKFVGGEEEEYRPVHPPAWSVNAVHARGTWPRVRHLEAVVNHPVVLGNGSILAANGYDTASKLLVCIPSDLQLHVPDQPTQSDAVAAVAIIDDGLQDFPFECPAHRVVRGAAHSARVVRVRRPRATAPHRRQHTRRREGAACGRDRPDSDRSAVPGHVVHARQGRVAEENHAPGDGG